MHFCQVSQNTDRVGFTLRNEEFQLRLECLEFLVRELADYLKAERCSPTLSQSLNHGLPQAC